MELNNGVFLVHAIVEEGKDCIFFHGVSTMCHTKVVLKGGAWNEIPVCNFFEKAS